MWTFLDMLTPTDVFMSLKVAHWFLFSGSQKLFVLFDFARRYSIKINLKMKINILLHTILQEA